MSTIVPVFSTLLTQTSIINFTVAVLAVLMGFIVLWGKRTSPVHQLFFLVAFNTGFWAFSCTMADVVREQSSAMTWSKMAIVGPFFLSAAFLTLSYYFSEKKEVITRRRAFLIFLPSVVALALTPTSLNIVSVTLRPWGTDFVPGPLYTVLLVHLLLYFFLAGRRLRRAYRKSADPIVRKQILFLMAGIVLVVASGIVTNIVLPLAFNYTRASVIGPAATLIFVMLTMYAIVRHGLLNLKIIATELFAGIFVFINFIQLFNSATASEYATNVTVFVLTALAAVMLVRSVFGEIGRREQIQTLAAQLESANVHLKEMDNLKDEFISIASHQLRTPSTVIKGYLSLMLEGAYGPLSDSLREKVLNMAQMNERLVQMINNMLNVSRIEKNHIEYTCVVIDLYPVIGQAVEEMLAKASRKGIAIRIEGATAGPVEAYVDMEKTIEVLSNLIDNSIKYSTAGTITVSAVPQPRKKAVIVTVADEGLGINKEDLQMVFTKFFRSSDPSIMTQGGTGLGLYVCAMFVRGMGGDIWVEKSAPGKGTTIAFALPTEPGGECAAPAKKKARLQ
jgi:signal transduction histidine kinase